MYKIPVHNYFKLMINFDLQYIYKSDPLSTPRHPDGQADC